MISICCFHNLELRKARRIIIVVTIIIIFIYQQLIKRSYNYEYYNYSLGLWSSVQFDAYTIHFKFCCFQLINHYAIYFFSNRYLFIDYYQNLIFNKQMYSKNPLVFIGVVFTESNKNFILKQEWTFVYSVLNLKITSYLNNV